MPSVIYVWNTNNIPRCPKPGVLAVRKRMNSGRHCICIFLLTVTDSVMYDDHPIPVLPKCTESVPPLSLYALYNDI